MFFIHSSVNLEISDSDDQAGELSTAIYPEEPRHDAGPRLAEKKPIDKADDQ
jgi:hypothetical protein